MQAKTAVPAFKPIQQKTSDQSAPVQRYEAAPQKSEGGLPDDLRSGIENLSGVSMGNVKVNYNSSKPAQMKAHAYAQDENIEVGPGQEKHLAHEAWHVVQQKQGRVAPTLQAKGVAINDDPALEHEADVMGAKALQAKSVDSAAAFAGLVQRQVITGTVQRNTDEDKKEEKSTAAPEPTTVEEVAAGLTTHYQSWAADDKLMMRMLTGPFEANWFKARGALTMGQWPSTVTEEIKPPHDQSVLLMNALVDTRWRVWKEFTNKALAGMQDEVKEKAESEKRVREVGRQLAEEGGESNEKLAKTLDPVGSMAVTSDVDLSLGGSNTEIAVGLINREFRKHFNVPYDPGTVFDINVYASDWIHGTSNDASSTETTRVLNPNDEVKMTDGAKQTREHNMEVWSLVKIRRNMNDHHEPDNPEPPEWVAYRDGVINSTPEGPERMSVQIKLAQANAEYLTFKNKVKTRMESLHASLEADEKKLVFKGDAKPKFTGEQFEDQGLETRASNEIYAELLLEVKSLRLRIKELMRNYEGNKDRIDALGIELGYKIAEALTYANEVYATEGAVQHTVLDQGAKKKLEKLQADGKAEAEKGEKGDANIAKQEKLTEVKYNLRKELFLQSANENVGDSLHSLHAYHHLPFYAVYRAGKYMSRLIEASGKAMDRAEDAKVLPNYEEIKLIGDNAMKVKSKKRDVGTFKGDKGLEGDPQTVQDDSFFKTFGKDHVADLRPKIIHFGAQVPVLFNKQKADAEEKAKKGATGAPPSSASATPATTPS